MPESDMLCKNLHPLNKNTEIRHWYSWRPAQELNRKWSARSARCSLGWKHWWCQVVIFFFWTRCWGRLTYSSMCASCNKPWQMWSASVSSLRKWNEVSSSHRASALPQNQWTTHALVMFHHHGDSSVLSAQQVKEHDRLLYIAHQLHSLAPSSLRQVMVV